MRTFSGLQPGEQILHKRLKVTRLSRTVNDLVGVLTLDELICLLDSALRAGWLIGDRPQRELLAAVKRADERSESALETLLRLILVAAGLAPEVLQLELFTMDGMCYARLDMAWPSAMLAVEADGREWHDKPEALYRDRIRQNHIELAGWLVLRFTWREVIGRPAWVASQVRQALSLPRR